MKYFFTLFILLNILCNKADQSVVEIFKGKLVLQGICMNYVIQIVEGSVNPILYEQSWVNPLTNTTYKNVFGLASTCTFPSNIKEGDEFYFTIPKTQLHKPVLSVQPIVQYQQKQSTSKYIISRS